MKTPTYSVVIVASPAGWKPANLLDCPAQVHVDCVLAEGLALAKAEKTARAYNKGAMAYWAVVKAEATRKAPRRDPKPATVRVKPEARQPIYAIILRHPGGLVELAHTGFSKPEADGFTERMNRLSPELRIERREMSWSVEVFPGRVVTGGPTATARR